MGYVGPKRYAQTTIRYNTGYGAHDTICSVIHLPFLAGKQRLAIPACNQKHPIPPITFACAVMMHNGYNNGGLLRVCRCSVFVMNLLVLFEYTGCYLRYLIFFTNFGMCYNCTVSYRIFLRAYSDMYRSLCIGSILVCRCIVSALGLCHEMLINITWWMFSKHTVYKTTCCTCDFVKQGKHVSVRYRSHIHFGAGLFKLLNH